MTEATRGQKPSGKIRVGLVGVGNWANRGHLPVLSLLPDYEIVAMHARRRDAAEAAAKRFGARHVLGSAEELAAHPEVDLVSILTTAPQHEEGVRMAIANGKDVYSEWPLTTSTETSRMLVRLATEAGVRHVVGLQRRLSAPNRYLRDLLAQGYVGNVRSVRLHVSMNYFQARRSATLRWTANPENFSSVVAIYGGHFLDALFTAVGRPRSFSSLIENQFREITIAETGEVIPTTAPDQLVMSGILENGAVLSVHIEGGKRNGSGVQLNITGDQGDLKVTNRSAFGDVGDDYIIRGAHGDDLPLETLAVPASYNWLPESDLPSSVLELANLYAALARDIRDGTNVVPTFNDGVWMHRLLDLVGQSSETGRQITLN